MRRYDGVLLGFFPIVLIGSLLPAISSAAILRNLKIGDRGEDVRELQMNLNQDSDTVVAQTGPGSSGNETAYFGPATRAAVMKLQKKYAADILAPSGLVSPTGFVGLYTRLFLFRFINISGAVNAIPAVAVPAVRVVVPPEIVSISPSVITQSTTELMITGVNFTAADNTVLVSSEDPEAFIGLTSKDGTIITLPFRFSTADALKKQLAPLITSGSYSLITSAISQNIKERVSASGNAQIPVLVMIRNANGTSKAFTLLIDITEILKEIGK